MIIKFKFKAFKKKQDVILKMLEDIKSNKQTNVLKWKQ